MNIFNFLFIIIRFKKTAKTKTQIKKLYLVASIEKNKPLRIEERK